MGVILDSDLIIGGERGNFDLLRWLAAQPDQQFQVAAITVAELWHGVERATAAHKAKRRQYVETILATTLIIPYTEETAREHARLWAKLASSGKMIGDYDMIIAATALERDLPVATFNVKHFSQVKGLTVIQPE